MKCVGRTNSENNENSRNQHLVFVRAEEEGQRTMIQQEFFSGGLVNLSKKFKKKTISFILNCQGSQKKKCRKRKTLEATSMSINRRMNK